MAKMVRKQLFITAEQNRKLKERAAATGVSEADLIRAGIDQQLEVTTEKTDWRSLAERLSSSWAVRAISTTRCARSAGAGTAAIR
jgi:hypothetical protein